MDYSEKRSLPISIPDYHYSDRNGERYVAFNIHMAGRHLCSRRYREFSNLHLNLKKEFQGLYAKIEIRDGRVQQTKSAF